MVVCLSLDGVVVVVFAEMEAVGSLRWCNACSRWGQVSGLGWDGRASGHGGGLCGVAEAGEALVASSRRRGAG